MYVIDFFETADRMVFAVDCMGVEIYVASVRGHCLLRILTLDLLLPQVHH
jgi:hypothetical protein